MKTPFAPPEEQPFHRILADVQRSRRREHEDGSPLVNPAAGAAFPFVESEAGPPAAWQDALDFFVESEEPVSIELDARLSDDPEAIARELSLDRLSSEEDLNRARRRFMWRNHPDRLPESQRALADRRVAVANMLIDRAVAKLDGAPPRRS
jgi:hypothetical protein